MGFQNGSNHYIWFTKGVLRTNLELPGVFDVHWEKAGSDVARSKSPGDNLSIFVGRKVPWSRIEGVLAGKGWFDQCC